MVKKRCFFLLAPVLVSVFLLYCLCGTAAAQENGFRGTPEELAQLYARSAVLMDGDSGRVLFGKEEYAARPMASTTKIMTCILALESAEPGKECLVSENAASQPQVRLGVREGETYALGDLLYSLMLESHNDSAVVIAENVAGSVEAFADMMNRKADEIGCGDTYFITPNGLDASDAGGTHSTTARDLALILRYCISQSPCREEFLAVTRTGSYSFTDLSGQRSFSLQNHNAFLGMMDGALTGKTGFTADAGYCYVGALESEGRIFIVALLACGWPNNKGYKWEDTKKLMQYGMGHYRYESVTLAGSFKPLAVKGGAPASGNLEGEAQVPLLAQPVEKKILLGEDESVRTEIFLPDSLAAPVKKGEKAGKAVYYLGDYIVAEQEISAADSVPARNILWCMEQTALRFFAVENKINQ